jgi:Ti-type conjugative transfer relaxase TraA
MAIYHMSAQVVSRSAGRSAVAAAAYRAGTELVDERTGLVHDYSRKHGVEHTEICMPDGCTWQPNRQELWSAVEIKNKRQDSVVAREIRLALPHELDAEQRKELVKEFAQAIANRYNIAVDVAVHAPDKEGDDRNHHAHLLLTTNTIKGDGLGNKCREMDKVACDKSSQQNCIESLREHWANLTNQHLERAGITDRVNHRSYKDQGIELTPTKHLGPAVVAMERRGEATERMAEHEAIRQQQRLEILAKPEIIAEKLTNMRATFTDRDVAKELNRYIDDRQEFMGLMAKVLQHNDIVQLRGDDGRVHYTTKEMRKAEQTMVQNATTLAQDKRAHRIDPKAIDRAIKEAGTMSQEQAEAVRHVTGPGRLAVIIGDAGTGKSFSMRTAAKAWESAGYNVRGAALAGKAADELQAGSGINSRTLASLEYAWSKGRDKLTSKDVLVIDEAGMVGSRQMGRVLAAAEKAGAKVVLLGDHKQLAAIEAGASFRAITERVGAAEITQVRRQAVEWQKEAGQQLARGSVQAAIQAYQDHGHVHATETKDAAIKALASRYVEDRTTNPDKSQIVLAHTNKDVQALNQAIRDERKAHGDLADGAVVETEKGEREFAAGDRIVFLKNDRDVGVKNGTLATIEKATSSSLEVRLDDGTTKKVDLTSYNNIDHGYAVTVHKAQGVTVDRGYVLATPSMDRALGYVAMTRHREGAELYHSTEDFKDAGALAKSMERVDTKTTTLDYQEVQHGRGIGRRARGDDGRDSAADARRTIAAREQAAELAIPAVENGIDGVDLLRELPARDVATDRSRDDGVVRADPPAPGQQRQEERDGQAVPGHETMADHQPREPDPELAPPPPQAPQPIYLELPARAEREVHLAIRETGQAQWDERHGKWQVVDQANMDKLAGWLPAQYQQQAREQAEAKRPQQQEQARREQEQAAREAAEAQARRDHERQAVDAISKRAELIERAQTVVIQERKEELAQATEAAQKSLDDMGRRPGTMLGMGKAKQEAWDKDRLARERVLEQAKDAEHKWFHYPDKKWAREQAAVRVDKANPELAALARDGEQIRQREEQQKRAQQQERVQENLQKIRQRKERERENDRGGRSR